MSTETVDTPLLSPAGAATTPVVVEEELLVIDRSTGRVMPGSGAGTVTLVSSPATDPAALREDLLRRRRMAAASAAEHGAHLVAIGAAGNPGSGFTESAPDLCGLTVQIGVPDDRVAVEVCRRLAGWLPVIGALTANSPYRLGLDTGHASWRFVEAHRRAMGSFVPSRRSAGALPEVSAALEAAERRLPEALRYWHARPAPGSPAVQIRAGDVGLSVDDTIVAAGLLQAAVMQAVDAARTGRQGISAPPAMARAAQWQAARQGLTGRLTDPHSGQTAPARQLLDRFAAAVLPADADHEPVRDGLNRLRGDGTGAERQRRIAHRAADARTVLAELARLTTHG